MYDGVLRFANELLVSLFNGQLGQAFADIIITGLNIGQANSVVASPGHGFD